VESWNTHEIIENPSKFYLMRSGRKIRYIGLNRDLNEHELKELKWMLYEKELIQYFSTPNACMVTFYLHPKKLSYEELLKLTLRDRQGSKNRLHTYLNKQLAKGEILSDPQDGPLTKRGYWLKGSRYDFVRQRVLFPIYRIAKVMQYSDGREVLREFISGSLIISDNKNSLAEVDEKSGTVHVINQDTKILHVFDDPYFEKVDGQLMEEKTARFNPYFPQNELVLKTKLMDRIFRASYIGLRP